MLLGPPQPRRRARIGLKLNALDKHGLLAKDAPPPTVSSNVSALRNANRNPQLIKLAHHLWFQVQPLPFRAHTLRNSVQKGIRTAWPHVYVWFGFISEGSFCLEKHRTDQHVLQPQRFPEAKTTTCTLNPPNP